jgi:hypothetical protein
MLKKLLDKVKARISDGLKVNHLKQGDLVEDIGDSFSRKEELGVVLEVVKERYKLYPPYFFGLISIPVDGVLVRWLDKKGTSHIYPACCVRKKTLSDQKIKSLKVELEKHIEDSIGDDKAKKMKPIDPMSELFPLPDDPAFPEEEDPFDGLPEEEVETEEVEKKKKLNKLQEQLKEVERIVKERKDANGK